MKTDSQKIVCIGIAEWFGEQASAVKMGGDGVKIIDDRSCTHTREEILPSASPGASEMFLAYTSFPPPWTNLFFPFCFYKLQQAHPKTCHPF